MEKESNIFEMKSFYVRCAFFTLVAAPNDQSISFQEMNEVTPWHVEYIQQQLNKFMLKDLRISFDPNSKLYNWVFNKNNPINVVSIKIKEFFEDLTWTEFMKMTTSHEIPSRKNSTVIWIIN